MKAYLLYLVILLVILNGCVQKHRPEPNFYKNQFTGEILSREKFELFSDSLHLSNVYKANDTNKKGMHLAFYMSELVISNDSIIQPFKYSVRIGNDYVVREDTFDKIGMEISMQKFRTIEGDSIQIGGVQPKPMLINLWFVECGGCIAEIPDLHKLQEKYRDKVDFVAITFQTDQQVLKFLKRKEFNFKHITNAENLIKQIGTRPYPENIFVDKYGQIKYIERALNAAEVDYFESILEDLLDS
jgi:thiol-disulfide isomerase/thioredoxin